MMIYEWINESSIIDYGYYTTGELVSGQPNNPAVFTNFSLDSENGGDYVVGEVLTA